MTPIPIREIVDRLGYHDVAYIYKVFEKHTHCTPKQYRKENRPQL